MARRDRILDAKEAFDPVQNAARIADGVVRRVSPLLVLILASELPRAIEHEGWLSFELHTILVGTLVATAFLGSRIRPGIRMLVYCGIGIIIGLVGLIHWGLYASGQAAIVVSLILGTAFGIRRWLVLLVFALAAVSLIGFGWVSGWLPMSFDPVRLMRSGSAWLLATTALGIAALASLVWEQMYRQLRESEASYRSLFEAANDAIFLMAEDRFIDCNSRTLAMFGCNREQILQTRPYDFSPEFQADGSRSAQKAHEKIASAYEGEPQFFEWRHCRLDGTAFEAEVGLNQVFLADRPHLLAIVRDITRRKEAEASLITYRDHLEEMVGQRTAQLADANNALNEFAYVVSHDLKAPLRAVSQLARWISDDYAGVLDEDGKKKLDLMNGRIARMYNLIDGILQYSRIGRVEEERRPIDLEGLVREVIQALSPPAHIRVTVENRLPVVTADRTRLEQVFQNLIGNAVKFMDKPEGLVTVRCDDAGDWWRFRVTDNGPGIDPRYHEKIFGIFQTLAPRDQHESTGIGLTLVKKIVELYSGKIELASDVGKGCTFSFTLPK